MVQDEIETYMNEFSTVAGSCGVLLYSSNLEAWGRGGVDIYI